MTPQRLFHLAPRERFEAWLAAAPGDRRPFSPASLQREGFVHLSLARQLAGTLQAHFGAATELALVEIDPGRAAPDLRLEPSRGGELFPHLYRPLRPGDLLRLWRLARAGSAWNLPLFGPTANTDDPPGEPLRAASAGA